MLPGFSNGCAIGCKACDGSSRGPIPWGQFKSDPFWDRKFNLCPVGAANSTQKSGTPTHTICDPKLRTVNTAVECGAADDWYQYSPVSAVVNVVASPSLCLTPDRRCPVASPRRSACLRQLRDGRRAPAADAQAELRRNLREYL